MKKYIIPILDVLLGLYLVFAVTSFNNPTEEYPVCIQVNVDIADKNTYGFLNKNEIISILQKNNMYPINKPMASVSPRQIEDLLNQSPFVSKAECYKTKDGKVFITITQRSPILRIKNSSGQDYYIDEKGGVMPNSSYTSDMIIATGDIDYKYAQNYLCILTNVIMASDLWCNEIEQINIIDNHGVELVPRVGEHIIFLGYLPESKNAETRTKEVTEFVKHQFDRLLLFYKYGLSQAGWNKYERVDLQYPNQIICKKEGAEVARLAAEKAAREEQERLAAQAANPENANKPAGATDAAKPDQKKPDAAKPDAKKQDAKKQDAKKQDSQKKDQKKQEVKKQDTQKKDQKKQEAKKPEAKKQVKKK